MKKRLYNDINKMVHFKSKGFTIVELLVATVIFAVVLLVALTGFLEMTRVFYAGVTITRTQDTTKQIVDDQTTQIKVASNVSGFQTSPSGYKYYCLGNTRYTINFGHEVNLDTEFSPGTQDLSPGANYGLLRDTPGSCAAPCVAGGSGCPAAQAFNNYKEMLGSKMRLQTDDIKQLTQSSGSSTDLYKITIKVIYGDDQDLAITGSAPNINYDCNGSASSDQYCDVFTLVTSVHRGLGA